MSDINKEKLLNNFPISVDIERTNKILYQMKYCICKINNKNGKGTGFFCSIPSKDKNIKVMITCNHVINEEIIKENNNLLITLNDDKESKKINLGYNKKIYTSIKYDTTIIEIKEDDNINDYIELDKNIFSDFQNIFNESAYIVQYPELFYDKQKSSVSYGIIKGESNNYDIMHYCSTKPGSSGSPILNISNNQVIGIHKESAIKNNFNKGTYLKYPIIEYLNNINIIKKNEIKNEINIKVKVDKKHVNKNIFFLDKTNGKFQGIKHCYDNLKELNEFNTKVYINNRKYKYNKYFIPEKEGIYEIKVKFNNYIKDCSFMFCNCKHIIEIKFSSFNTKCIINMSHMFYGCKNLKSLDLSSFDTKNVMDMSYMFYGCLNLIKIDLSTFDTKNVVSMCYMFCNCENIENLNLSSFNTKNVANMSNMFNNCKNIKKLDLSSFDTKIVKDMSYMFWKCVNITNLDLSSFYTKNVENMSNMFSYFNNIDSIKIKKDLNDKLIKQLPFENKLKIYDI